MKKSNADNIVSRLAQPISEKASNALHDAVIKIKETYKIKDNFDLITKIIHLRTEAALFECRLKNNARLSKIKKELISLEKSTKKLLDAYHSISNDTHMFIDEIPFRIAQNGYYGLEMQGANWSIHDFYKRLEIFNQTLLFSLEYTIDHRFRNTLRKNELKKLQQLSRKLLSTARSPNISINTNVTINNTPEKDEQHGDKNLTTKIACWHTNSFYEKLDIVHQILISALNDIPADIGGRKHSSLPKNTIFWLAVIYEQSTGIFPECHWDESIVPENYDKECNKDKRIGCYTGNFYDFLIILKVSLKLLNLPLGTDDTIGEYAKKAVAHYKKAKDMVSF